MTKQEKTNALLNGSLISDDPVVVYMVNKMNSLHNQNRELEKQLNDNVAVMNALGKDLFDLQKDD